MPLRVGAKSFEPPCAAAVKRKGAAVKRALTPGTFDPITAGHLDVISRAAQLVDEVIVAVAVSAKKKPLFSLEERVALVKEVTRDLPNVRVEPFDELLVDFARRMGAQAVVKGLRAITDFEYEFQMTALNYQLDKELGDAFHHVDAAAYVPVVFHRARDRLSRRGCVPVRAALRERGPRQALRRAARGPVDPVARPSRALAAIGCGL